ncbi:hypothetical protein E3P92_00469 [Wallemia ichthyophaga]|nr:hypothetical protein E3P95_00594 [Wallemia ichthyophaga]TIB04148.1 hypothetical protein E3P94_00675 [Wallemia ichthyophaga]TIB18786.1 hypothetical protein E3P92_00469 [Wallemia ichthyophaga]
MAGENEAITLDEILPIDDSMIEYTEKRDRFADMFERSVSSFEGNVMILDKYWYSDDKKLDKVTQFLPHAAEFKLNGLYYNSQFEGCLKACLELLGKHSELSDNKEIRDIVMRSLNRLEGSVKDGYVDWLCSRYPSILANEAGVEDSKLYRSVKEFVIDTLTDNLINEILFEIVLEAKTTSTKMDLQRQQLQSSSLPSLQQQQQQTHLQSNNPRASGVSKGQGDPLNPNFECLICNRWISCNRYAPHLNNCLGLRGSRGSTRAAASVASGASQASSTHSNTTNNTAATHKPPTKHTNSHSNSSKFDYLDLSSTLKHTNKPRQSSPLSNTPTHTQDYLFSDLHNMSKDLFSPSNSESSALSSPPKGGSNTDTLRQSAQSADSADIDSSGSEEESL